MNKPSPTPSEAGLPPTHPTKFVAAIFDTLDMAQDGARALLGCQRDNTFTVLGMAVIERQPQGALTIVQAPAQGPAGDGVRALLSDLAEAICTQAAPALGLVTDLGSWGDLTDFGVTRDYVWKIAAELRPGRAAVLAEIEEDWVTPLDTRLEEIGGCVIRTWRSDFEAERQAQR